MSVQSEKIIRGHAQNVIDQPKLKTFGEPETFKWFVDERNSRLNRIRYYQKKYCQSPQPNTTSMDQKSRAKVLSKWRNDKWNCAKKKHDRKLRYWVAYLDGQQDANNQNGLDWLDKWQKDYNDKLDSIVKDHNERIEKNRNEARDRYLDQLLNNGY